MTERQADSFSARFGRNHTLQRFVEMAKKRSKKHRQQRPHAPTLPTKPASSNRRFKPFQVAILVGAVLVLLTLEANDWWRQQARIAQKVAGASAAASAETAVPSTAGKAAQPAAMQPAPHGSENASSTNVVAAGHTQGEPANSESTSTGPSLGGSFLQSFSQGGATGTEEGRNGAADQDALEDQFRQMLAAMDERSELLKRLAAILRGGDRRQLTALQAEGKRLANRLNGQLSRFESQLKGAREARPKDPLVCWMTGELLMAVGGEPAEILPYFQQAVKGGLDRPRLYASLGRIQFETNQFASAYESALRALRAEPTNDYIWDMYERIARGSQRFSDLIGQLDRSFPDEKLRPDWATSMHERAARLASHWNQELQLRAAADLRKDLPRVRFKIQHRRFVRDSQGNATNQIETIGTGQVDLELFANQAPETVRQFLRLVKSGFYDGTCFFIAESASYVRGGDPNTKNDTADDDGAGGPGFVIPDEYMRPDARKHFRGSLSLVNTGPGTAGSQFFITLTPNEAFDGHFTVFGRVIRGQDVVDAITLGRTTSNIGRSGKMIPGDLLVHASVLRPKEK